MRRIGLAYIRGRGVPEDYAQAAEWCRRAAEGGDAHGAFNLALLHHHGLVAGPDPAQALEWWRRAEALGHPDAARWIEGASG